MIIISHYTIDTPYEQEKDNLVESLKKFNLNYVVEGITTFGSWRANSNFCAKQVLTLLKKHKQSVLRVDCDAIFYKEPELLKNIECDIAGVIWKNSKLRPKGELLGGTLYFAYNKKTLTLVEEWVLQCKMNPRARNSDLLQTILKHYKDVINFKELPLSYCMIFDSMKAEVKDPVIKHFQASRRFKSGINIAGKDEISNFKDLKFHVNSDTCVFLGSAKSINDITENQWNKIKRFDIWTVNNWIYHPVIVPNFYHIECKHYNCEILQRRFKEKWKYYKDVKFIFPKNKSIRLPNKTRFQLYSIVPKFAFKYYYDLVYRDRKRTAKTFSANYIINKNLITKSYDLSVTLVLEMIFRMGYKRIILFGVDFHNSFYFWSSGDRIYGEVHHLTHKAHENKDPNLPYGACGVMDFISDFNSKWMLPNNKKIYVGYKDTLLYPEIDYIDIEALL